MNLEERDGEGESVSKRNRDREREEKEEEKEEEEEEEEEEEAGIGMDCSNKGVCGVHPTTLVHVPMGTTRAHAYTHALVHAHT